MPILKKEGGGTGTIGDIPSTPFPLTPEQWYRLYVSHSFSLFRFYERGFIKNLSPKIKFKYIYVTAML